MGRWLVTFVAVCAATSAVPHPGLALRSGGGAKDGRVGAAMPNPAQQPVFRAATDLVTLGVTVSRRGGPVSPRLGRDEFQVLEDGVPQSVSYFAAGDDAATAPPLHLGLLFDTSGSMGEDIQLARTAAIKFLNTLPEAVDVTLVDFDTEVRAARFTQQDFPRLVERIRSRKPQGFTAIYDALGLYLDGSAADDGRTILVVFSDGGDTRSALRFSEALTLLRASDVTVYTIGLIQHQSASAQTAQRAMLTQLASESGGEAFFPRSMRDVESAYAAIEAQIRGQYSLGYLSTNTARDGRWRRVEVHVRREGLRGVEVRTRRGYFAPFQAREAAPR
jgi:Ca-activated chloride channel homolog